MSQPGQVLATPSTVGSQPPRWIRIGRGIENGILVVLLTLMMVVPILEIVLRKLFGIGIVGSTAYVRHFTLLVGMLGGAIAAREDKLLSLSTLSSGLKGQWREVGRAFSGMFAVGIALGLVSASWSFVMSLRPYSQILPYGVPVWVLQLSMPIGFALLAWRSLWHTSTRWSWRAIALAGALVIWWFLMHSPVAPEKLMWPALGALLVATLFGAPLYVTLGGAAMILFWGSGRSLTEMANNHYELVTNEILPSIPLFTLAGYFLAEGGASKRLVHVFQTLVGQFRGGAAIVTSIVCAFFTAFTGASGVTILALGSLLMPALLAARMSERSALGLLTSAGSLGVLLPPCLPLILYSVIAQQTVATMDLPANASTPDVGIERIFLAGIVPGVLLVVLTAAWAVWETPKGTAVSVRFDAKAVIRAIWNAKWELMLPVLALVLILGGLATPVEASAASALYAFVTQTWFNRDLSIRKDVPRIMTECGLLVGGVLLILGVAMGLTAFLIFEDVPTLAVGWIQSRIESRFVFLLLLNLLLLVVGCLMDIFSAIIVVVPLIIPIGIAFGVDPVHLGIIFLANLQVGYITPPVGMNLFLASYRFNKPVPYIVRSILPVLVVLLIGVLLITYIPALSMLLPQLFAKKH
jgi:tripartite ATP-independent transporter DctM subunit